MSPIARLRFTDPNKSSGCKKTDLAETVVVKDTQSLLRVKGLDPVMSSHCDGATPPAKDNKADPLQTDYMYIIFFVYFSFNIQSDPPQNVYK